MMPDKLFHNGYDGKPVCGKKLGPNEYVGTFRVNSPVPLPFCERCEENAQRVRWRLLKAASERKHEKA